MPTGGEIQQVQARRCARCDLHCEPIEHARAAFGSADPNVGNPGVPFIVEIIVGDRIACINQYTVFVGREHERAIVAGDGQRVSRVTEPVGETMHRVGCGDFGSSHIDQGVGPWRQRQTVLPRAERARGVTRSLNIDGHRIHPGAVARVSGGRGDDARQSNKNSANYEC
jgi:hypothetical protein